MNKYTLKESSQKVLDYIIEHGDQTQMKIAHDTGLSQPTVHRAKLELVRDGWVQRYGVRLNPEWTRQKEIDR